MNVGPRPTPRFARRLLLVGMGPAVLPWPGVVCRVDSELFIPDGTLRGGQRASVLISVLQGKRWLGASAPRGPEDRTRERPGGEGASLIIRVKVVKWANSRESIAVA